jgi:flagellar motility protein MotE (MotC chaperone)
MNRRVPLGASSTYLPVATSRPAARQSRQPVASSSQINDASAASSSESQEGESAKKKRCRVTREQLEQLEILFAANMSPTIERRKEIAIALGMTDRQTQIWFQNRYEVFHLWGPHGR